MIVVAMGVSGSGKSTFGAALAETLGGRFGEGDDLHPPANVARMKAGHPLTDADRAPWLDRVAEWMRAEADAGRPAVISCSALKRAYRDRLRAGVADAAFVLLDADADTLRARITGRAGHYMPASLLDSQLTTLERPGADERALTLDATRPVDTNVAEAIAWLRGARPHPASR